MLFLSLARKYLSLLIVCSMLFVSSSLFAATPISKPTKLTPLWDKDSITLELVQENKVAVQAEIDAIPADAKADGEDGHKKTSLQKELGLIGELENILGRLWQLAEDDKTRKKREVELTKKLKKEKNSPKFKTPKNPNLDEFEAIKERMAVKEKAVKTITEEFESRAALLQNIPQNILTAKEAEEEARNKVEKLMALDGESNSTDKQLIERQKNNLLLAARVAKEQINLLKKEQEHEQNAAPLRELSLELARLQFEKSEQQFTLYQGLLQLSQEKARKEAEDQLAKKQQAVELAATPQARALALWESDIAQLQNNIADLKREKTKLLSHISNQEKQLNLEKDNLKNLKNLVNQVGASGPAAEILKTSYLRVSQSRQELSAVISPEQITQQQQYQTRRIELDSQTRVVREKWEADFKDLTTALKGKKLTRFRYKSTKLLNQKRALLREEKNLIFDLITEGQRLLLLPIERKEALDNLENFVLSQVFWIQDETPLGLPMLKQLFTEIGGQKRENSLWNWWKQVLSIETISSVVGILRSFTAIVYGALIFIIIPITLYLLRVRLHKFVREQNKRGREHKTDGIRRLPIILASLAGSMLNPVFFLLAAPMIATLDLPVSLGPILSSFLVYFAFFMFLWLLSSSFFNKHGVAVSQFGVSQGVAQQFLNSFRLVLITYLACFVPWIIFHNQPFMFEAFPRIAFIFFEAGVVIAIYRLIRPGSPLIKQIFSNSQLPDAKPSKQERYWAVVSRIAALFMASILVLDGAGYHFGATYLSINGLWSLFTILVLATISRTSALAIRKLSTKSRGLKDGLEATTGKQEHQLYMFKNLLKLLQLILIGLGLYLLAHFWGLNESALIAITDTPLFQTTNSEGQLTFVTALDILISATIIFLSIWVLRHLTGLYETILFPFFNFDDGLKYAVITISRYLIIIFCAVWITSVLQVDLSKIGWVVAAMSVGLGFGLQEIVANFVSGIILLIERPIRVGDMVSIGTDMYGQVTQVNIRSTTILSRDRLEVLVPNKDLISKEVVNWTLSDSVVREKLNIGVAYGSDVEQVRSILFAIAKADPEILETPQTNVLFLNHGDSSLDFEVRFFLNDPIQRRIVIDRLNTAINREFNKHNIEIPFPQRDLHIIPNSQEKEPPHIVQPRQGWEEAAKKQRQAEDNEQLSTGGNEFDIKDLGWKKS
ncbi:MAG: mechanosensitive ion channel [Magnetococcales bacterium]|nr:mechanosensitive ion channel [Magnetococcales bacterium]